MGGRSGERSARCWMSWSKRVDGGSRQIHFPDTSRRKWEGFAHKLTLIGLPRKASMGGLLVTVP